VPDDKRKQKKESRRNFKRLLVLADTHIGHRAGLALPDLWKPLAAIHGPKYGKIGEQGYKAYQAKIDELKPFDYLILNGDIIDGPGIKSAGGQGSELILPSINQQIEYAGKLIKNLNIDPTKTLMTYGTPYHVGQHFEAEKTIANEIGCKIKSQLFFKINGFEFNVRHQAGSHSYIPTTRAQPLVKEWLSNLLWKQFDRQPQADVIIRSHVHYHFAVCQPSKKNQMWWGIFTPALQQASTKLGRRLSNVVHFGFIWFDIYEDYFTWDSDIIWVEAAKEKSREW